MNSEPFEQFSAQSMVDIMSLPDDQRQLVNWIIRQKNVTLAEVAVHTNVEEEVAKEALQILVSQGFIQELNDSGLNYQPRLAPKQKSRLSKKIWDSLDD